MRRRPVEQLLGFWEPIRGRMTVTDDDRHALQYKTRANLLATIPQAISNCSWLLKNPADGCTAQKNTTMRV